MVSIFLADFLVLDLKESLDKFVLSMDAIKLKAWIITKCFHKTAHFLARSFSTDFHFPKFCCDNDPNNEAKLFERGRYIELRLFEIQPIWYCCNELY